VTQTLLSVEMNINPAGDVPIYRQILGQIRSQVALGLLEPGTALPSIRVLALELKVAPNTIAKAYDELATAGVVHKRRGFGTFVSCERTQTVDGHRRHIIEDRIDALLAEAQGLNFTPEMLLELLHRRRILMSSRLRRDGSQAPSYPIDSILAEREGLESPTPAL